MTEPYSLTLTEAARLVRERKLSPVDLVEAALLPELAPGGSARARDRTSSLVAPGSEEN